MAIRIDVQKQEDGYIGAVYLDGDAQPRWVTSAPLPKQELMKSLLMIGIHERDAWDAFAFADGKGANVPHPFFDEAIKRTKK